VDSTGTVSTIKYFPFGLTRSSDTLPTDKEFTGQRLDSTALYYYGARYYDPEIGRFISPDTVVPDPSNPQALNRYSYCINNPLKYTDPTGHVWDDWMIDYYMTLYGYGTADGSSCYMEGGGEKGTRIVASQEPNSSGQYSYK
jgi:RHS repeat-associated protein